ncbi:MAG: TatD family hydrolase [Clostridia bacterium]
MPIIDTHCHLNDERLWNDHEGLISGLSTYGIESVVCVGYDTASSKMSFDLATKFDAVYAAVGIHPHDSKTATDDDYSQFKGFSTNKKVVAIGEIGLDYFYDLSPRDDQKRVFVEQLELADSVNLPVILHIRDAYEDARAILFDNKNKLNNGFVLHCYSGSPEYVKIFDKLDAFYSFGGAITFKNARRNLEAMMAVPKDRLLLETDCPYMTPTPYRGQTNLPKYINLVADKMADELKIERAELVEKTTLNAKTLFTRLK